MKRPLEANQPISSAKKDPKPVMPQGVLSVRGKPIGEDDASNARNVKMLQTLAMQVCTVLHAVHLIVIYILYIIHMHLCIEYRSNAYRRMNTVVCVCVSV